MMFWILDIKYIEQKCVRCSDKVCKRSWKWVSWREKEREEVDTDMVGEGEVTWRRRAMHLLCPKLSRDQKIITEKADNSNLTQHCKTVLFLPTLHPVLLFVCG